MEIPLLLLNREDSLEVQLNKQEDYLELLHNLPVGCSDKQLLLEVFSGTPTPLQPKLVANLASYLYLHKDYNLEVQDHRIPIRSEVTRAY